MSKSDTVSTQPGSESSYAEAGVDIDAANCAVSMMKRHIASTRTAGTLSSAVGGFGGMFSLRDGAPGMHDPVLVSSIDGVGTKLKIAFLAGKHDTIGADLVSHCVNDILVQGARPLFFLDYFATGRLEPYVAAEVVKGLAAGCCATGCVLIGGETAEMPGMYAGSEYDLAGCIVGIVDRARIVDGSKIVAGDVLIGIESDGLHTNGYSLARKVILQDMGLSVASMLPGLNVTVAEALLAPHRCALGSVLPLLDQTCIKGMAHITGGGLIENVPRILPNGLGARIDRSSWQVPAIFKLIQQYGNINDDEAFRVFNMGIGFVLFVSPEDVDSAMEALQAAGDRPHVIGKVVAGVGVKWGGEGHHPLIPS